MKNQRDNMIKKILMEMHKEQLAILEEKNKQKLKRRMRDEK